jgi:hypothetical protein
MRQQANWDNRCVSGLPFNSLPERVFRVSYLTRGAANRGLRAMKGGLAKVQWGAEDSMRCARFYRENGEAGSGVDDGPGETGNGDNSCSLGGRRSGRNDGSGPAEGCEPCWD